MRCIQLNKIGYFKVIFVHNSFRLAAWMYGWVNHMFVLKLSRAHLIHKLNHLTDALTVRLCSWTDTHIGNVSSAPLLLFFSFSLPFTAHNDTLHIIIDVRYSHNCCHEMCKLGKMCKQMTDFSSFSSLFLFSLHRLVIRTTNFWLTRYQQICERVTSKTTKGLTGRVKRNRFYAGIKESMGKETSFPFIQIFSLIGILFTINKHTHTHKSSVIIPPDCAIIV